MSVVTEYRYLRLGLFGVGFRSQLNCGKVDRIDDKERGTELNQAPLRSTRSPPERLIGSADICATGEIERLGIADLRPATTEAADGSTTNLNDFSDGEWAGPAPARSHRSTARWNALPTFDSP